MFELVHTRSQAYLQHDRRNGFTLVELVVVLAILGIISAIAAPRFFTRNQFDAYGFAQDARAMLRYAQKSAIAKRRNVCVVSTSTRITLTFSSAFNGACDTSLNNPGDDKNYRDTPSGITISASTASFSFNALGQPSVAPTLAITGGDVAQTIIVETETGYVH